MDRKLVMFGSLVLTILLAAAAASAVTSYLSLIAPIERVDRLVLCATLFFPYFFVMGAMALLARLLLRLRGAIRPTDGTARENDSAAFWQIYFLTALFTVNGLAILLGYKDITFDRQWIPIQSGAGRSAIVLTSLVAALSIPEVLRRALRLVSRAKAVVLSCSLFVFPILLPAPSRQERSSPQPPSTLDIEAGRRPIVLIALDGVDGSLLRTLTESGRLPQIKRMRDQGVSATLDNDGYGISPAIWTSLATGKRPHKHGIYDFVTLESPLFRGSLDPWWTVIAPGFGVKSIYRKLEQGGLVQTRVTTGEDRRGPSIWQVLSRCGGRSLVVNYMNSFPAEKIEGVFLAQYLYHRMANIDRVQPTPISPSLPLPLEGYAFPEGILEELDFSANRQPASEDAPIPFAQAEFRFLRSVTLEIAGRESFDLITFYSHLPDVFNHVLSIRDYEEILLKDFSSTLPARFLEVYGELDDFVGAMYDTVPEANFLLVSDHGVARGYRHGQEVLQHRYAPGGIFIAHGPDIARDELIPQVSMYDVVPTVLNYFGLPAPQDSDGEVLPLFRTPHATEYIDSYDPVVGNERVNVSFDTELNGIKERLRSLGYIQ